jgi:hypothetical protein
MVPPTLSNRLTRLQQENGRVTLGSQVKDALRPESRNQLHQAGRVANVTKFESIPGPVAGRFTDIETKHRATGFRAYFVRGRSDETGGTRVRDLHKLPPCRSAPASISAAAKPLRAFR